MLTKNELEKAFAQVRLELAEIGLLARGVYLDEIECKLADKIATADEMGYVYIQKAGFWERLWGSLWGIGEEGIIFVPKNAPVRPRQAGMTLVDVIRHEFAHAWEWHDPDFFRDPWFRRAFGADYHDHWVVGPDPAWRKLLKGSSAAWQRSEQFDNYVSPYACVAPMEDFAESFMFYLRYRDDLERFRDRPGVYQGLQAVGNAVQRKAKALGLPKTDSTIECPVYGNSVIVDAADGDYTTPCPWCDVAVVVTDGVGEHGDILEYTCPDSRTMQWVPAEKDETFECDGCKLDVRVEESDGYLILLHQLRLEN